MARLTENKIILIKRKTRLEELIARYNTIGQVKFYIEHLGSDFSDYVMEDGCYKNAISEALTILESLGKVQVVDRDYVPNFIFGEQDIVVVIGQDGLVANTMKYLEKQLLVGVNPDPTRWDGILLPYHVKDLKLIIQDVFKKKIQVKEVTLAKAVLNDGQSIYGVNDLFVGQKSHVSSRYQIKIDDLWENQSSSGVIISTGLGSTGWLKSVIVGATNITYKNLGKEVNSHYEKKMKWNSDYLYYSVREPFPSRTTSANLVFGKITKKSPLKIVSQMSENGVIFSDGVESDFLQFNAGLEATISIADKKGHLVV